jgi:hypothetical protein
MDDAAIAGEQAAFRHGMDGAEGIDPVLQWHSFLSAAYLGWNAGRMISLAPAFSCQQGFDAGFGRPEFR